MAYTKRIDSKVTGLSYSKSPRIARHFLQITAWLCLAIFIGCKTSAPQGEKSAQKASGEDFFESLQTLTVAPLAAQPALSADGKMLAFISWESGTQRIPQAYVLDLANNKKTRWTFTNGWIYRPFLAIDGLYYSNTSEEQEDFTSPSEILKLRKISRTLEEWLVGGPTEGNEIYFRALPGSEIKRLSRRRGVDLVWSSSQRKTEIHSSINDKSLSTEILRKGQVMTQGPTLSSDKVTALLFDDSDEGLFVSSNSDGNANISKYMKRGQKPTEILSRKGQVISLSMDPLNPNELWMAANFADPANWDIYVLNLQSRCLTRMTTHPDLDLDPAIYGERLYFTSRRSGALQIQKAILKSTNRSCL